MDKRKIERPPCGRPDFRALFESAPGLYLVLTPELVIAAVSDAYARATMTCREEVVGRDLFDVFPDNPDDPATEGVRNLRASLERVIRSKVADSMPVQKYDIRKPEAAGGGFEERYWSPHNKPVLDADGTLIYIIHCVVDITEFVKLKNARAEQQQLTREARQQVEMMESQIFRRAQEVAEASRQLKEANAEYKRAEEEARAAKALAESILENIPNMVFVKDAKELRFVRFNRAGEALLGYSREQLIGKSDYDFFPPEEADFFTSQDRAVLEGGQLVDIPEEPIQTKDKQVRFLHTKKLPINGPDGKPAYLLGISEDITERKLAEERIRQLNLDLLRRASQLEAANKELESFSYSVSHDLRSPLRSLDGFSRALMEDYGAVLDATAVEYLNRIRAAAQRMDELIDALLQLSRFSRQSMHFRPVDVTALGNRIIGELRKQHPERVVETLVDGEMAAHADPRLLAVVLQNLLGNAWKYTSRRSVAHVHFGVRRDGPAPVFFIRDDGAGFDMEYSDKLFGAFQRLHSADEFEGTGIGLATVQRIIARHGGRVWAEAAVGAGATFYFTLSAEASGGNNEQGEMGPPRGGQPGRRGVDLAGVEAS
ncbi:MAG TPA: PAS domain-containing protein [bacterium]|nr:PAS domain-containing protein [bacterium]